jgi:hypothetical protein
MKKRLFCIFICTVFLLSLFSCQKSPENIYSLLENLCEGFSEEYGKALLFSDKETGGFTQTDGKTLGRLYSGKWEAPACFSQVTGYAIRLPLDDSGFEIHIIKCVNPSDTDEVSALLQKRIDKIQSSEIKEYAPESYEKYFVGSEVYVVGDTVFLLATPDNSLVKSLIKKYC